MGVYLTSINHKSFEEKIIVSTQSMVLLANLLLKNSTILSITITYEGLGKTYTESTTINIKYLLNNVNVRKENDPIETIFGVIQDISNRNL